MVKQYPCFFQGLGKMQGDYTIHLQEVSAPEHFQGCMSEILSGLPGIMCMMDNILVHRHTKEEHDNHLSKVLQ